MKILPALILRSVVIRLPSVLIVVVVLSKAMLFLVTVILVLLILLFVIWFVGTLSLPIIRFFRPFIPSSCVLCEDIAHLSFGDPQRL